jgi:hypothetical protein
MTSEVRFRALLAEGCADWLELARAQGVLRARLQNGMDALASMRNCINTGVRFRALVSNSVERLELVMA